MSNEQGELVCSSLDQDQPDGPDLFADLDEIHRGIRDLQTGDVVDEEKSNILNDLRTHFAYLEHIVILTGDSARLESDFHKIEMEIRDIKKHYQQKQRTIEGLNNGIS